MKISFRLQSGVESNSTASVPSKTLNLNSCSPEITIQKVMGLIGRQFLNNASTARSLTALNEFIFVNPSDINFPG